MNYAFGTGYKQYSRPIWKMPDGVAVWMVHMDGSIRNDWKIDLDADGNRIVERYVGNNPKQLAANTKVEIARIAVNIIDSRVTLLPFMFEIVGVYRLSFEKSRIADYRVWEKVDEYFL